MGFFSSSQYGIGVLHWMNWNIRSKQLITNQEENELTMDSAQKLLRYNNDLHSKIPWISTKISISDIVINIIWFQFLNPKKEKKKKKSKHTTKILIDYTIPHR